MPPYPDLGYAPREIRTVYCHINLESSPNSHVFPNFQADIKQKTADGHFEEAMKQSSVIALAAIQKEEMNTDESDCI